MPDIPEWVENRLDSNLNNKLSQRHVVETMLSEERPFFSPTQLRSRVKPDVTKETVRNRLDELQELDIVATETYPDTIKLYYINHEESVWPLSPEGKKALKDGELEPFPSLRGILTLSQPDKIKHLTKGGFLWSLAMIHVGIVLAAVNKTPSVETSSPMLTGGFLLWLLVLAVMIIMGITSRVRERLPWKRIVASTLFR